ncbi:hypothetical protein WDU94_013239 [Cyamophila willieti]
MADAAKAAGKRMDYPYTWTAKFVNFPWKLYFTKQWIWKTLPFSLLITLPMFYKISQGSNTESNKIKWAEIRRQQLHPHHDD